MYIGSFGFLSYVFCLISTTTRCSPFHILPLRSSVFTFDTRRDDTVLTLVAFALDVVHLTTIQ